MTKVVVTADKHEKQMLTVELDGENVTSRLVSIEADMEDYSLPYEYYKDEDGFEHPAWRAGITTFTIRVDGAPVFISTDPPLRVEDADHIRYVWGGE